MSDEIKKILEECGCNFEYEICLKYLQQCFPDLDIDCVTQMDYYFTGKDEFIKLARNCLNKKDKTNE